MSAVPAQQRSSNRKSQVKNKLAAPDVAEQALDQIAQLIGKDILGVTSVQPADEGWQVGVEVVEESRVPSSADVLATYEVELDGDGELLAYRRMRRYPRGRGDNGNGGS